MILLNPHPKASLLTGIRSDTVTYIFFLKTMTVKLGFRTQMFAFKIRLTMIYLGDLPPLSSLNETPSLCTYPISSEISSHYLFIVILLMAPDEVRDIRGGLIWHDIQSHTKVWLSS